MALMPSACLFESRESFEPPSHWTLRNFSINFVVIDFGTSRDNYRKWKHVRKNDKNGDAIAPEASINLELIAAAGLVWEFIVAYRSIKTGARSTRIWESSSFPYKTIPLAPITLFEFLQLRTELLWLYAIKAAVCCGWRCAWCAATDDGDGVGEKHYRKCYKDF